MNQSTSIDSSEVLVKTNLLKIHDTFSKTISEPNYTNAIYFLYIYIYQNIQNSSFFGLPNIIWNLQPILSCYIGLEKTFKYRSNYARIAVREVLSLA